MKLSTWKKMAAVGVVGFLVLTAVPVNAQEEEELTADPGMSPDSPFYFLELFFENLGTAVTFDEVRRAQRYERLAEERLAEAKDVIERNREQFAQRATERYEVLLKLAVEKAEEARAEGRDTSAIKERVLNATDRHQRVLERVLSEVPEQARPAIKRAYEASLNGQVEAMAAISMEDPDEALGQAQERMQRMREHLQDVREQAGELDGAERDRAEVRFQAMKKMHEAMARMSEEEREEFVERVEGVMSENMEEMKDLEEDFSQTDAQLAERFREINKDTVQEHVKVMRELAERDPEEAARRFEEVAARRLERAERRAERGDERGAQANVEEFEEYSQFGAEISETAQGLRTGDSTVEELVERATSRHLEILRRVRERVPEEARSAIDRAIDESQRHREQTLQRMREFEEFRQRAPEQAEELRQEFEQRTDQQRQEFEGRRERSRRLPPEIEDLPQDSQTEALEQLEGPSKEEATEREREFRERFGQ